MHQDLKQGPVVPQNLIPVHAAALLNIQMAPRLTLLLSSGSKKKKPRYACLCEAKASHTNTEGLRFLPLLHTKPHSEKMSSQGIRSSKKANNNPGLCPIKLQKSDLCSQIGAQN